MPLPSHVQTTILYHEGATCELPFYTVVQWLKLFVTEYLIKLKEACGAGTESFDSEKYLRKYLREREAFGKTIMAWRSIHTIDIYDQSRSGEAIFSVLAGYQQDLAQRRYAIQSPQVQPFSKPGVGVEAPPQPTLASPVVWMHDEETLNWIKSM
jgi:hypothetical protein